MNGPRLEKDCHTELMCPNDIGRGAGIGYSLIRVTMRLSVNRINVSSVDSVEQPSGLFVLHT